MELKTKEKVKAYVREQIPALKELSKGCEVLVPTPKHYNEFAEADMTKATVLLYAWQQDYDDAEEFFYTWLDEWNEVWDFSGKLDEGEYEIIGHPPQLQHYLQVLEMHTNKPEWDSMPYWFGVEMHCDKAILCAMYGSGVDEHYDHMQVEFSLTTGEPATEKDWQALAELLGVI